jgi:hypothetical protein
MRKKFIGRFVTSCRIAFASVVFVPAAMKSQEAPDSPVITAPAGQATANAGELEKVTVTGFILVFQHQVDSSGYGI